MGNRRTGQDSTLLDCQTRVDVHATTGRCQSTYGRACLGPVTETLARELSADGSRSIAPWPLFARNTNGRLRSTRIDWLLPSGECIVVTYATRRALSPRFPVLSAGSSRQDAGPSVDDRCDTVSLIRHDIWRRSTNKRRRRSLDVACRHHLVLGGCKARRVRWEERRKGR